jgi:hypothetical protein
MRQALAVLARWQARRAAEGARQRLLATFAKTVTAAHSRPCAPATMPSGNAPIKASVKAKVVKFDVVAPSTPPRVAAAKVSRIVVQVEDGVRPPVDVASDPAKARCLLEALCRLDGRAFSWQGVGQTVFVRLFAPDGTEERMEMRVPIHEEPFQPDRRYPGISQEMADPPLPRPLWEMVYARVYGDNEP